MKFGQLVSMDFPAGQTTRSLIGNTAPRNNAIYNALRSGTSVKGCRMYVPWFPCMDCARAIVQVGIRELIAVRPDEADPQWGEGFTLALQLFRETKVTVRWYKF